jgi:hypothetical protein
MGWKSVQEYYEITHIVQVTEKYDEPGQYICIGSPYIHDIITISIADGRVVKRYRDGHSVNPDLHRYQTEFDADPEKLRELVGSPDSFGPTQTVYTWKDGEIIEKQCEKLDWPNTTTDGLIMYENSFSTDRSEVVRWAIENARIARSHYEEQVEERAKALEKSKKLLHGANRNLESLLST